MPHKGKQEPTALAHELIIAAFNKHLFYIFAVGEDLFSTLTGRRARCNMCCAYERGAGYCPAVEGRRAGGRQNSAASVNNISHVTTLHTPTHPYALHVKRRLYIRQYTLLQAPDGFKSRTHTPPINKPIISHRAQV